MLNRFFTTCAALSIACFVAVESALSRQPTPAQAMATVYIGTYTSTSADSQGIYQARFDSADGALQFDGLAGVATNPSFLAISTSGRFAYAVCEVDQYEGSNGGAVASLAVDPTTKTLTSLNRQSSGGGAPCFISLDRRGKHALVANYNGGSVAVLPIDEAGRLGPAICVVQHHGRSVNPTRQTGPHAHCIKLDAASRFALAADLGLDKVFIYRFDEAAGTLTPNDPPWLETEPGAGPRHLAFHPNGKWVYILNELNCTLLAASYDAERGALRAMQTLSTLPSGAPAGSSSAAEVVVHPSGKFVYSSNRGDDSITMFAVDQESGRLASLGQHPVGGKTPRNFNVDPAGGYLLAALQGSNRIAVHAIDQTTGLLTATDQAIEAPTPVCVTFAPQ